MRLASVARAAALDLAINCRRCIAAVAAYVVLAALFGLIVTLPRPTARPLAVAVASATLSSAALAGSLAEAAEKLEYIIVSSKLRAHETLAAWSLGYSAYPALLSATAAAASAPLSSTALLAALLAATLSASLLLAAAAVLAAAPSASKYLGTIIVLAAVPSATALNATRDPVAATLSATAASLAIAAASLGSLWRMGARCSERLITG